MDPESRDKSWRKWDSYLHCLSSGPRRAWIPFLLKSVWVGLSVTFTWKDSNWYGQSGMISCARAMLTNAEVTSKPWKYRGSITKRYISHLRHSQWGLSESPSWLFLHIHSWSGLLPCFSYASGASVPWGHHEKERAIEGGTGHFRVLDSCAHTVHRTHPFQENSTDLSPVICPSLSAKEAEKCWGSRGYLVSNHNCGKSHFL